MVLLGLEAKRHAETPMGTTLGTGRRLLRPAPGPAHLARLRTAHRAGRRTPREGGRGLPGHDDEHVAPRFPVFAGPRGARGGRHCSRGAVLGLETFSTAPCTSPSPWPSSCSPRRCTCPCVGPRREFHASTAGQAAADRILDVLDEPEQVRPLEPASPRPTGPGLASIARSTIRLSEAVGLVPLEVATGARRPGLGARRRRACGGDR